MISLHKLLLFFRPHRLTQLLEEPVKSSETENSTSSKESHLNGDALQHNTDDSPDSPSNSRRPVSATSDTIPLGLSNGQSTMEFESPRMSRKRKSCDRDDSDDNSSSSREVEEPQTILQEADSTTTTVGADKVDTAMIVDAPSPPLTGNTGSSDVESEQSAAKKHKPSSPEAVVPVAESGADALVSSVLDESEQVQNMSTGQSEALVEN